MSVCRSIIAVVVLAAAASPAQAQLKLVSRAAAWPTGAERLVVHSQAAGGDFVVVVTPPGQLITGAPKPTVPPSEKRPAVYALDGGYGVAGPVAQLLASAGAMQPAYVVSISYPEGQDGRRNTDFLHTPVTENGRTYGGGGRRLEAFLVKELRPYLETRYPLDPGRAVLFGHSFGGLFAANVLADAPDAFAGYIIGSASVWRDPELPARVRAVATRGGGRRVLVAAGGQEDARMLEATNSLAAAVSGPGSSFAAQKTVFAGKNHLSYYAALAEAGLTWTLSPTMRVAIAVPPERLAALAGVYAYPDGRKVTIKLQDGALRAAQTGLPGDTVILAETPRRFFVPGGYDVTFDFEGAADAPPSAITVRVNGGVLRAVREPS